MKSLSNTAGQVSSSKSKEHPAKEIVPDSQADLRTQRLLDIAAQAFLESGFEGVSMSKIAQLAGASKETFYARYKSKADLFAAVMDRFACGTLAKFDRLFHEGSTPEQVLTELGVNLLDAILNDERLALLRIVFAEAERFPELAQRFWENGPGRGRARLAEYLREQVRIGTLEIENIPIATKQFFGMITGEVVLVAGLRLKPFPSQAKRKEFVHSAVQVFLRSYGKQAR